MNKKIILVAAVVLANTGMTWAAQQDKKNNGKETTVAAARNSAAPAADSKTAPTPATTDPAYVIGPEDVLDISVWKERSAPCETNVSSFGWRDNHGR